MLLVFLAHRQKISFSFLDLLPEYPAIIKKLKNFSLKIYYFEERKRYIHLHMFGYLRITVIAGVNC